jgi:hypothetical protein
MKGLKLPEARVHADRKKRRMEQANFVPVCHQGLLSIPSILRYKSDEKARGMKEKNTAMVRMLRW